MDRPKIPEAIRRQVRRECFFGCVLCGAPLFDYDHMTPYSEVHEHEAQNLVLLCRNHHSDKTAGRLSLERVSEARANPFNQGRQFTAGYKIEPNRSVDILLGSNSVSATFPNGNGLHHAIWNSGDTFLAIHVEDHWVSISLVATDARGQVVLVVDRGEIVLTTGAWDFRYEGSTVKVWAGARQILFEAEISNDAVRVHKGSFINDIEDGFLVDSGALVTLIGGNQVGLSVGSTARNNGFGGWGLLNSTKFPDVQAPRGFGIFRRC